MKAAIKVKKIIISLALALLTAFVLRDGTAAGAASDREGIRLIPLGAAVSISVEADGVLVVGINQVDTPEGASAPAFEAGLREGDFITHVGKNKVTSAEEFRRAINSSDGQISVRFVRAGRKMQLSLKPASNQEGVREIGVWLRSGMAGIGTMTFIEPGSGLFGALGHSVSDTDTGVMIPLKKGLICRTSVTSVIKGTAGKPGELKGELKFENGEGRITLNTQRGIFGYADAGLFGGTALELCPAGELKCGGARILADVGEGVRSYAVEISRVYHDSDGVRDMLITVTDARLIELAGGIVQGMSGSPVLQNGKLAGAVTHVLVGDPRKGYGISIEHMLEAASGEKLPRYIQLKSARNK